MELMSDSKSEGSSFLAAILAFASYVVGLTWDRILLPFGKHIRVKVSKLSYLS